MYFQHSLLILMITILWQAYAWIQCWINLFTWILTFLIILPKLYYFLSQLFYLESCYRNHLTAQLTPSFTGLLLLLLLKKKTFDDSIVTHFDFNEINNMTELLHCNTNPRMLFFNLCLFFNRTELEYLRCRVSSRLTMEVRHLCI